MYTFGYKNFIIEDETALQDGISDVEKNFINFITFQLSRRDNVSFGKSEKFM